MKDIRSRNIIKLMYGRTDIKYFVIHPKDEQIKQTNEQISVLNSTPKHCKIFNDCRPACGSQFSRSSNTLP